ncbi:Asp-tRNA(Asn)/Glu-tRNA(Gln) amidotransferase subunit GatC (plasmid) [Haladaptatus sp. SPP-AMP-3]|uniref:Asp-tRNA(Asn)/Glu-tRNA(Gln) amidotransferase subunit GatC n=1 Tax=Haladaptatus sp. SPP-AMP-3 TaxID=3121295 RepID=UPI003C2E95C5
MSDTPPGPDEVRYVARLARVGVSDAEAERFAGQFADILGYFETLDEVPEVEREADLVNVMREDEVRTSLDQADALDNAPETEDGYFKGPNVS